jgi:hypothetical protein
LDYKLFLQTLPDYPWKADCLFLTPNSWCFLAPNSQLFVLFICGLFKHVVRVFDSIALNGQVVN